jgi:hypothetical protein
VLWVFTGILAIQNRATAVWEPYGLYEKCIIVRVTMHAVRGARVTVMASLLRFESCLGRCMSCKACVLQESNRAHGA